MGVEVEETGKKSKLCLQLSYLRLLSRQNPRVKTQGAVIAAIVLMVITYTVVATLLLYTESIPQMDQ